jgi:hypothetical protein
MTTSSQFMTGQPGKVKKLGWNQSKSETEVILGNSLKNG